jgi:hypothetical protein
MCCNRPRQAAPAGTQRVTMPRIINSQPRTPAPVPARVQYSPPGAVFEYVGASKLTIVSPVTRKTYCFEQPGAKVAVDARDRSWVAFVPKLVPVP